MVRNMIHPKRQARLDSMLNQASGLGTSEDSATYGKPTLDRRLTSRQLSELYITSDLAQRIVDELVNDSLRQYWEIHDAETGEVLEEPEELDIFVAMDEACKDSRLYGNAAILMLYPHDDLTQPLEPDAGAPSGILNLDRDELIPATWGEDPRTSEFRKITHYYVVPTDAGTAYADHPRVHVSRLLMFRGTRLPYRIRRYNNYWAPGARVLGPHPKLRADRTCNGQHRPTLRDGGILYRWTRGRVGLGRRHGEDPSTDAAPTSYVFDGEGRCARPGRRRDIYAVLLRSLGSGHHLGPSGALSRESRSNADDPTLWDVSKRAGNG